MSDTPRHQAVGLISERDFGLVAARLKSLTGIHLSPHKRAMVSGRLAKRLRALGLRDCQTYLGVLDAATDTRERDAFISALTTNMTRFCREQHHFKHFSDKMLPRLVAIARKGGRVRIWSSACSTGEEAYDLAFRVLQACPEAARLNVRLLATDIDRTALATAKAGIYPESSLNDLPERFRETFVKDETMPVGMARVCDEVRKLITFRELNINAAWPFKGQFDVILCRNVSIYFDETTNNTLWSRLAGLLRPEGVLYAGHSEILPSAVISPARQDGPGTYVFPDGYRTDLLTAGQTIEAKEKPDGFERKTTRTCG